MSAGALLPVIGAVGAGGYKLAKSGIKLGSRVTDAARYTRSFARYADKAGTAVKCAGRKYDDIKTAIKTALKKSDGAKGAGKADAAKIAGKSGSSSGLKINQLPLAKPGEDLYVGTYSKSSYWNKKTGLNKTHTPHHVVQDAVSSVSHGKGITINIRKDIHLKTETYGSLRTGLTNRQHLAADIAELRVLLKEQGYSRSTINAQLNELIKQNKALGGFEK